MWVKDVLMAIVMVCLVAVFACSSEESNRQLPAEHPSSDATETTQSAQSPTGQATASHGEESVPVEDSNRQLPAEHPPTDATETTQSTQGSTGQATAGTGEESGPVMITRQDLQSAGFDVADLHDGDVEGFRTILLSSEGVVIQIYSSADIEMLKKGLEQGSIVRATQKPGVYGDKSYTGNNQASGEDYYSILYGNTLITFSYSQKSEPKIIKLLDAKFPKHE